jgi:opacity protein-like surface antigen
MKKTIRLIILAASIALVLPRVGSAAQSKTGGYVSGFLGVSIPRDTSLATHDFSSSPVSLYSDNVSLDPGISTGATGGYDFGLIRLEGEISYKHSEIKTITDQRNGEVYRNVDGTLGAAAFMANAFINFQNNSPVTPYLGGGTGFATLHLSDTFGSGSAGRKWLYDAGDDTVFAYQLGGGVDIAINRRFSLDVGYRYFATDTATFSSDLNREHSLKFESHTTNAGFRVRF